MTVAADFFDTEPRNWRARLAVSVEVMRELSRAADPQEMYAVFARRMVQLFPVSRHLTISRRGLRDPEYRVTRFSQWNEPVNPWKEQHRLPMHHGGLFAELLYGDQPRVIDNLRLDPDDPASEYLAGQRSLVAIPHVESGPSQNMVIATRDDVDTFPRERVPDLLLLSNLFARATQTVVLSQAVKEAFDGLDYELRSIAEIQKSLLPAALPKVPHLDVAVHYQTAKRAGGDYYDFFPLPNDRLGVLIADASGHGAPAAVLMALAHSIAHTRPEPPQRPGEFLTYMNAHLTRRYTRPTGSFMTAFYAVFDPINATLSYASAGHNPPRLLRCADGFKLALNRAQKLPLGIKPDEVYLEQTLPLLPGDQVVLFTDGVIEAVNTDGDVFGSARIDEELETCLPTANALLRSILASHALFTSGTTPADDRTLVVVKRTEGSKAK
ncbi:PP2C family protein-serine/threonine phosphatase [Gemmata sp. JC717]|uniref:PP2C family protein-serine/threonine phosphatase n=1 Tax=Gemmata algarum TaxID=2975278 RepID=A0ABU5EYU6_9BACT|nr:PP2C family protein-serine/threonine phosphatase [Gemmata algarum]MDY3556777.1 PP2C family protein-serine/threonine phosphatase [Gemmata algarum]MDY3560093.1 PP2C family protein-serine/threonine phosphatase [Gemmata algarum]